MNVQTKTVFIFNRILIDFFKEIKKDKFFKLAIKKNYKVIDKKSPKYINFFLKKINRHNFNELFLDSDFNVHNLKQHEELLNINILKNINISKLLRTFSEDKENIMSYILILYLFSYIYNNFKEQVNDFNNNKSDLEKCIDDDDEGGEGEEGEGGEGGENADIDDIDEEEKDEGDGDSDDDDEDDDEEEGDKDSDDEITLDDIYEEQQNFLFVVVDILEKINKKEDINDELSEIIDDEIRTLLENINKVKVFIKLDSNIDDIIGDSKIGNLAKEISESINLDSLNIENPEDLLNPANLFGGNGGNLLGNLVQQVGASITSKLNSGEIQQDELVKDAFSLMSKMQNSSSSNPIINEMMNNMMNNRETGMGGGSSEEVGGVEEVGGGEEVDGVEEVGGGEKVDGVEEVGGGEEVGAGVEEVSDASPGMPDMSNIGDMLGQMMGGGGSGGGGGMPDMSNMEDFMSKMMGGMNPQMMQDMVNNMGGTQALNQNNPKSREGQMRQKLQAKLAKKEASKE